MFRKNFYLIFKQSFKGVFKYKIQFIIIMILCFLSTFMLSASFAIKDRINDTYDKVVKTVEPFDYTTSIKMFKQDSSTDGYNNFVIGSDLQTSQFTSFKLNDSSENINNYNFDIMSNDSYWKKTILNSSFFKEGWSKIDNIDLKSNNLFNFDFLIGNENNKDDIVYSTEMIDALTIGFFESLISDSSYEILNNGSLISEYLNSNSDILELSKQIGNQLNSNSSSELSDQIAIINNSPKNTNEINFIYNVYISSAWLVRILLQEVCYFKDQINSQTVAKGVQTSNIYKDDLNLSSKAFQFIFGQKLNEKDSSIQSWLGNENDFDFSYGTQYLDSSTSTSGFATITSNTSALTEENESDSSISFSAVEEKGLRGQINPLILILDDNKKVIGSRNLLADLKFFNLASDGIFFNVDFNNAISASNSKKTENTQANLSYISNLGENNFIHGSEESEEFLLCSISYTNHLKMSANISNMELYLRREIIVSDPISTIQYRGVVLDSQNQNNFTILKGKKPTASGEIALSQEFAKKNHCSLGDSINIGNGRFTVTAFATDAYSYYPISDPDFPVPQPKVSAIVYGSDTTINKIFSSTISTITDDSTASMKLNLFFTSKNKNKQLNMNKFLSYQFNSTESLSRNSNIKEINSLLSDKMFDISKFSESNYRFSWTLQPLVTSIFLNFIYVISFLIWIIAIFSLIICIKKTINFNSKQIAILKAMGEETKIISASYLSYSLIITLFIIPLGWVMGNMMQMPLSIMFANYFSIKPNELLLDFNSLIISVVFIGLIGGIISFISAFLITNKPIIQILTSSIKWSNSKLIDFLNNTLFKYKSFSLKFSLNLASSGKKTIGLLVLVSCMATLLTSIGLMIPATAQYAKNMYYKSVKYSNEYQYGTGSSVSNAPLSKQNILYWNGQDTLEDDWQDDSLDLDGKGIGYGYYTDPDSYSKSIDAANPIPKYTYSSGSLDYSYVNLLKNNNKDGMVAGLLNIFGNNFSLVNGTGFSIGMIDKFFGLILNSSEAKEIVADKSLDTYKNWTDTDKIKYAQKFSSFLTSSIPTLISAIVPNSGGSTSDNWKKQIIEIISSNVPPYVKSFMSNDSRYEQYVMGWNNDSYIPGEETYTTTVSLQNSNYSSLVISGIDKPNIPYNIYEKDEKNVFVNQETINNIESVIDGTWTGTDITYNGFKLYDASTKTLNIPAIFNKQAIAGYNTKKGQEISNITTTSSNVLGYKKINSDGSFDYIQLPKYAWAYDDSDFANSDFYSNNYKNSSLNYDQITGASKFSNSNTNTTKWLDLYALENNKMSFKDSYTKTNNGYTLNDDSYLFDDFSTDSDNNLLNSYVRPYYEYKNVKLFIPESAISSKTDGSTTKAELKSYMKDTWVDKDSYGNSSTFKTMAEDTDQVNDSWFKIVKADDVPQITKNAYDDSSSQYYIEISPYDAASYTTNDSGITMITDSGYYNWFYKAGRTADSLSPVKIINDNVKLKNVNKINLVNDGTLNSYNSKVIITDIRIANILNGYSNYVEYGNDASLFDKSTKVSSSLNSKFDTYKLKQISLINSASTNVYNNDVEYAEKWSSQKWHNGKLSNIDEPLPLTSAINYSSTQQVGLQLLGAGTFAPSSPVQNIIDEKVLLTTTKNLISQVYMFAISIGAFLVIAVIITSTLSIMIVGDIYISQYQRFMILMRSLGYSKSKIRVYAFGSVVIFSIIGWIVMTIASALLIESSILLVSILGWAFPFAISWWPPLASFVIIFSSLLGSLFVSSKKLSKDSPASLMTETHE